MGRFSFIGSTGVIVITGIAGTCFGQVVITEVRTGSNNNEYIELKGTPGASLGGLTLLIIGDGVGGSGTVEWRYPFAKSDVFGSNGYLEIGRAHV